MINQLNSRTLINIVNYAFIETLPLEFLYLDNIAAFFGGSTVYYLGVYSYGTTVTKPEERAHRLARLDGVETLGNVLGTLLSPFVFRQLGYFGNYAVSAGFFGLAIAYLVCCVREPIQRKACEKPKESPGSGSGVVAKVSGFLRTAVVVPLKGMKSVLTKERKPVIKLLIFLQFFCYAAYLFTLQGSILQNSVSAGKKFSDNFSSLHSEQISTQYIYLPAYFG
jgi:hypothetical protein